VTDSPDYTEMAQALRDGFSEAQGLEFTRVEAGLVEAKMTIGTQHRQSYGIVHGGVYAAMSETLCAVGAAVTVMPQGRSAVGLENHTSFVRAVRDGVLYGRATPVHRGRRSHVWQADILDDAGRVAATSRVRVLVLDADTTLAGEAVTLQTAGS